jgi:hypothetical protein
MKVRLIMLFVLALILQSQTVAAAPLFELPREYWGEYNEMLKDCGTGNNDSRLRISWNTIRFFESTGELTELLRQPDGSIVVVAKHSGEGQTWQSIYQLRLSDDRQVLTVIHPQTSDSDQLSTGRKRCAQ